MDRSISESLLDQQALAGIGNVYKSEVLHVERVSPFAANRDLDDATLARLVATARRLLQANIDRTGSAERVTTRGDRSVRGSLYVYRRAGRPCRRCGTRILARRQGITLPRITYWCPACQGDGTPQPTAPV